MKPLRLIAISLVLATAMLLAQPRKESVAPIIPLESTQIVKKNVTPIPIPKKIVTLASLYKEPTGEALEIATYISVKSGAPLDIIKKIMWAESQHYRDAKHVNKNGSYDTGYMQINSQHIALAESMDIDIFTPYGNADFAVYLILKNGLRDWGYSKSTWSNI